MDQNPARHSAPLASDLKSKAGERILSVDALRGFDMFWIVGGEALVFGLTPLSNGPVISFLCKQLEHKEWAGFAFLDLIFPLFVFLVGVSLVFSLGGLVEREGKAAAHKRIFRRFVLLFLLGVFYYGGFSHYWPDIRLVGVLQRLALCYLFAGLLFCYLKPRALVAVCAAFLVGYWLLLCFVPVPDVGVVSVTMDHNWPRYIDDKFLPGEFCYGGWDPEGLLSTIPAVASCLLGVFAGLLLKNKTIPDKRKAYSLFLAGIVLMPLGYLWGLHFPVIKNIWTSSFVLVAGGYSYLLLGLFFTVIDLWKIQRWAKPFFWIGANSLTIYLLCNMVSFSALSQRFVGGDICKACNSYGNLVQAIVQMTLILLLVRFLYRRKIFLRV
jgi:predicted acyltransferase